MPYIKIKDNESFDYNLRNFKRACEKAGIIAEVKRKEFYEKPAWERKRKAAAAQKRTARNLNRERRQRVRMY